MLPVKLDSDSKLHIEKGKLTPHVDRLPKSSISDSKLAVDYFNAPQNAVSGKLEQTVSIYRLPVLYRVNDKQGMFIIGFSENVLHKSVFRCTGCPILSVHRVAAFFYCLTCKFCLVTGILFVDCSMCRRICKFKYLGII